MFAGGEKSDTVLNQEIQRNDSMKKYLSSSCNIK